MVETYPIVKFPNSVHHLILLDVLEHRYPVAPIEPKKLDIIQKQPYPIKPTEPKQEEESFGCLAVPFGFFIFFFFLIENEKQSGFFGFCAWLLIAILIGLWLKISLSNSDKEEKYKKEKSSYSKVLEEWKIKCLFIDYQNENKLKYEDEEYQKKLNYYHTYILPEHVELVNNFKLYKESLDGKKETNRIKKEKISEILKSASKSIQYEGEKRPNKGVSEEYFYQYILKRKEELKISPFVNNIDVYVDKVAVDSPYFPDLVVVYTANTYSIRIDVEIDEPYVGKDGSPIHYVGSSDDHRDFHFLHKGWVVVRFTEEQIIKYTEACFRMIVAVVSTCSKFEKKDWIEQTLNDKETSLVQSKRWTKDEAHTMAFKRYRNTYLEKSFIEKLSFED